MTLRAHRHETLLMLVHPPSQLMPCDHHQPHAKYLAHAGSAFQFGSDEQRNLKDLLNPECAHNHKLNPLFYRSLDATAQCNR